ncbi:T9SS type A sorting domain-containing protein [Tenacibaculum sp.]|nr:T9SS type A sorting domain-containing protein [Tenacibaculum sp.]
MTKKIPLLLLLFISTITLGQDISFTFSNARNTNDGIDDYYEADIYIASTVDFKLGSGQIYFTYNTAAFGTNIKANGNFEYLQPSGSILGEVYGFPAYKDFIDNDNTTSRVSTSFQQGVSSGTITANNVTSTAKHLFSIKIKYTDVTKAPMIAFETGGVFLDQFYTACGPATFGFPDCTNSAGSQLFGDLFDSTGGSPIAEIVWNGSTDSSWTDGTNFDSSSVPLVTDDIIIPNVGTTPEVVSNVQINDLTIEASSTFDISETGSVIIDGNFSNNGAFTMTSIGANSSALIVKGSSSGQVIYERGGLIANKWSIVSAPVTGQNIKDFAENIGNDIRINTSVTPNQYAISYYDDSQASGSKWVYYDVDYLAANPSETFEKGRSYAISRGTDGVVTFTGTVETADVTKTVSALEWNAIGNPFTAFLPINENAGTNFINDNLSKFNPVNVGVYTWDSSQSKYVGKSLVSSEASLAPGQGFLVKTTTGVSDVTFSQSERKTQPGTGGTFARGVRITKPSIQLLATLKDVTIDTNVKYFENTTEGLDPGYDLGNYARAKFDVYTRLKGEESGKDFTIQSLPMESIEATVLPIGLKAASGEQVSFTVKTQDLSEGVEVFIEDKELNTFIKLSGAGNEVYTVKITESVNSTGRFYLHTKQNKIAAINTDINNINIYTIADNILMVNGISEGNFEMTLYAIHGALILHETVEGNGKNSIALPSLQTGVYIVRINSALGEKSQKIIIK